jgi:hypothetical protein
VRLGSSCAHYSWSRNCRWHRLDTVAREALNAKDALKAAHLDGWGIQKQPLTTADPSGKALTIPSKFATVRRNPDPDGSTFDTLGIVGEDYRVWGLANESRGSVDRSPATAF